jgi:hypothetical protein
LISCAARPRRLTTAVTQAAGRVGLVTNTPTRGQRLLRCHATWAPTRRVWHDELAPDLKLGQTRCTDFGGRASASAAARYGHADPRWPCAGGCPCSLRLPGRRRGRVGEGGVAPEEPPHGDAGTSAPPRIAPARIEASAWIGLEPSSLSDLLCRYVTIGEKVLVAAAS